MASVTKRLEQARRRMKLAAEADVHNRKQETEDLAFQVPELQWDSATRDQRSATTVQGVPVPGRPMLSVAPVDEPIQLVSNQARAAHLACSFHPLSADANDDTASVLQGLYDQSANESRADNARFWAYDRALWCGRGVYRLDKVYDPEGGHPFDQKIVWRRLLYQDAYYRDPSAQEQDRSDALWAFVVEALPEERYESKYSKSKLAKFTHEGLEELAVKWPEWFGGDSENRLVRVAEYWRVELRTRTWVLCDDGQVYDRADLPAGVTEVTGDDARSRDEEIRTVFWSKINCTEELEPEQEWDGQYIPLMEVIGRELQPFDGKRRWAGMMTNSKDPARMINYSASGAVEMSALEPKAPFEWDPRQIKGFETYWQQANIRNFPGLPYNATVDGQVMAPPQRVQVDVSRLGPNMQILSMSGSLLQSSMSTFDPALGKQPTAHRSGKALEALQGQTVEANSHYLSNLANISLMYEAKVWLDLAPRVYDRPERVVRILKGGKSQAVMLGMPFTRDTKGQPQSVPSGQAVPPHAEHFDLSKGRYGVATTIGKSSASRLQQGNDALTQIIQAEPGILPVVGPLWASTLDVPFHEELADLLKRDRDHRMPWLKDPNDTQVDTQSLQAENQALKQQLQIAMQQLQTKLGEIQAKGDIDLKKTGMQEAAETDRADKDREAKLAVAVLQAKYDTLQNGMQLLQAEIARIGSQQHDVGMAQADRTHEMLMGSAGHDSATQQADQAHQQATAQAEQGNAHAQQQAQQQAELAPPPADGGD